MTNYGVQLKAHTSEKEHLDNVNARFDKLWC